MTSHHLLPVILCGGSGTRLWPLSRETYPKQFVDLGEGRTLFKDTLLRAQRVPESLEPVIVCENEDGPEPWRLVCGERRLRSTMQPYRSGSSVYDGT